MVKGNILNGEVETTQVQSNQYDLLAKDYTWIEGWNQQTFEAYDDAPQEGSFDWGSLIVNVLAGLAVVGAVALTLATFGAAAPVIIGAVAVGTTAVIGQGISDYTSGTVSSLETYITTGFWGAVAGAASGGVGAIIEGTIPAGAAVITKMGIVGVSGMVETVIENTIQGQDTSFSELAFSFVFSAGLFGLGDNLSRVFKKWKSAANQADNATRVLAEQADNVLDNAIERVDNVLENIANHGDDVATDIASNTDDIVSNIAVRGEDLTTDAVENVICATDAIDSSGLPPLVDGPYIKNGKPHGRPALKGEEKLKFEQAVYDRCVGDDGILRDPNTREIINWKPGQPRRGVVDFGHNQGKTYNEMFQKYKNREITLEELKEFQFNPKNFRLESPSANRSHRFE